MFKQFLKRLIRSLFYLGSKYQCPICNMSFRKFLEFGVIPRKNAMCPFCGSLERHRLLWLYFQSNTDIFKNKLKLLHVAPEYCFQEKFRRMKTLDYISIDLCSDYAMFKMDITNLEYADNIYDMVICNHVLEHIVDDAKALEEIFRVLKPEGIAILQVPIDKNRTLTYEDNKITTEEDRLKAFGQKDHVRIYGQDYKMRLEKAGFNVTEYDYKNSISHVEIEKYLLPKEETIFVCEKTASIARI